MGNPHGHELPKIMRQWEADRGRLCGFKGEEALQQEAERRALEKQGCPIMQVKGSLLIALFRAQALLSNANFGS